MKSIGVIILLTTTIFAINISNYSTNSKNKFETNSSFNGIFDDIVNKLIDPIKTINNTPTNPVMIIPGFVSIALEAKLDNADYVAFNCFQNSDWQNIWVGQAEAFRIDCTMERMKLIINGNNIEDPKGVTIRPVSGCKGISKLGYGFVHYDLYEHMLLNLEEYSLIRDDTIIAMNYDWRKWGNEEFSLNLFNTIKNTIENMQSRTNMKINIVAHSMGNNVAHLFLAYMSNEWKDMQIKKFVAFAPPFAGASQPIANIIEGLASFKWIPIELPNLFRGTIRTWPAVYSLNPHNLGGYNPWSEYNYIVKFPNKKYQINNFTKLYHKLGMNESNSAFNQLYWMTKIDENPPNVETSCIQIYNNPTEAVQAYSSDDESTHNNVEKNSLGDGTVNIQSMRNVCNQWKSINTGKVNIIEMPGGGSTHVTMLNDDKQLNIMINELMK